MIRIDHQRLALKIPRGLIGKGRRKKELALLIHVRDVGDPDSDYWSSSHWRSARDLLFEKSAKKCAYCETSYQRSYEGDLEHFRPKSKYWWLAYCIENYLFSCKPCNQAKGSSFPVAGSRMARPKVRSRMTNRTLGDLIGTYAPDPSDTNAMTKEKFQELCEQECALLLDPYNMDPEGFLAWEIVEEDEAASEKRWGVRARAKSEDAEELFQIARDHYGLNRKTLREKRWQTFDMLQQVKKILEALHPDHGEAREMAMDGLRRYTRKSFPYAGMSRYFVCDEWKLLGRDEL